jgi:hypothetical protein
MGTNFSDQTTDTVIEHYEFRIKALTNKLDKIFEIIEKTYSTDEDEISDIEAVDEIYKLYN